MIVLESLISAIGAAHPAGSGGIPTASQKLGWLRDAGPLGWASFLIVLAWMVLMTWLPRLLGRPPVDRRTGILIFIPVAIVSVILGMLDTR